MAGTSPRSRAAMILDLSGTTFPTLNKPRLSWIVNSEHLSDFIRNCTVHALFPSNQGNSTVSFRAFDLLLSQDEEEIVPNTGLSGI